MVDVVYISGTRCSTKEKRMLAELLAGKRKKQNDKKILKRFLTEKWRGEAMENRITLIGDVVSAPRESHKSSGKIFL